MPEQEEELKPTELDSKVTLYFAGSSSGGVMGGVMEAAGFFTGIVAALKHPEWAVWLIQNTNAREAGDVDGIVDDIVKKIPARSGGDNDEVP